MSHRPPSVLVLLALGALLAAPAAGAAPERPSATAAKTCNISGKERKLGTNYVLTLSATGTSCTTAQQVVKGFHACRHQKGKAGRCTRRVSGFSCSEKRVAVIDTQYDAKVTCKKGKARVKHAYTQFT